MGFGFLNFRLAFKYMSNKEIKLIFYHFTRS